MTGPRIEVAPDSGAAVSRLIEEQVAEERARKASLETRGVSVVTTAGVLVTLLLGFAGLVNGSKALDLPTLAEVSLVLALVAFTVAASAALYCNVPLGYEEPDEVDLREWLAPKLWRAEAWIGEIRTAEARLDVLAAWRTVNDRKAQALLSAIVAEVLAILLLATSVAMIVLDS